MTCISCISDCHLGYRHRLKEERLRDYERSFLEAVDKAVAAGPDVVVFGGDVFHHPKPDADSLKAFVKALLRISKISKVVVCVGNHEIEGSIRNAYAPVFSELSGNVHVLTTESPHVVFEAGGKKIGFHGFQFIRGRQQAEEALKKVSSEFDKKACDKNILCLHQAIEGYLSPHEISLTALKQVASRYDLVLSGHVHKTARIQEVWDDVPAYYIGCTERTSFNEAESPTSIMVFRDLDFDAPEIVGINAASMKRVRLDMGRKTPEEINSGIRGIIEENRGVRCLQVVVDADVDGSPLDVRWNWEEQYSCYAVLDVRVLHKTGPEADAMEKVSIGREVIEEYFDKTGLSGRTDLRELCLRMYEKYGV